jgi:hypothetical protein
MTSIGFRGTEDERFWKKVIKSDNGCWEWIGGKNPDGYGSFGLAGGKVTSAHRWSYEKSIGPIPNGLTIDHICRNRACVNPDHLECVSFIENILRGTGWTAINKRKGTCPAGHEYDKTNNRGSRICSECARAQRLSWYYRNKNKKEIDNAR